MHYGASLTGDENINNSMDTHLIGNPASYDDKLYTFKEGDYNRLRLQDIEDMLLLLVQGKLTNLNIEERLALGVSLRMFTRSIVIRRRVEDLQLGIERKAGAIIQAIDRQLKNRRIMRSLEKFIGGRLFDTSARNLVKEILPKLNLPDHRSILTDSKMDMERRSVKVKEPQERCIIKAFQDYQIKKGSHSRQAKEQAQDLKSMITTSIHKLMIEAKDYELKTKVKA
ncbi:hypothetical protein Tco_0612477 [Tanacetum coccineum]